MGRDRHAILGRPLADLFRNISFANPSLDRTFALRSRLYVHSRTKPARHRPIFFVPLLLYANIAGVISSTWMITSAGMSLRRAAFLIASALSAS